LCYFYFDYSSAEKQTLSALLKSLIFQLAAQSNDCHALLKDFHKKNRSSPVYPTNQLFSDCLENMLRASTASTIIIDALDECERASREDVLRFLRKLADAKIDGTRILVTSRPDVGIRASMIELSAVCLDLHETDRHGDDLAQYVSSTLAQSKYSHWPVSTRRLVENTLVEKANGM
jgi:archaellum biogenesis ATPase FlaH